MFSEAEKQRRVQETGLIRRCEQLALKGKTTHWSETDCKTHVIWEYKDRGFEVFFESGTFHLGNGREIKVSHKGREVFHVYDGATKKDKYPWKSTFIVDEETHVGTYEPGEWEDDVESILSSQQQR